jgi:hypothetical protein
MSAALDATAAEIASNYRLTDYRTGAPFRLYDLAGTVILLDFFSPTCLSCQQKIPHIESEIADFCASQGGNADGLPVTVLYINEGGNADQFIATNQLDRVANDDLYRSVMAGLWNQPPPGVIPFYVLINGVTNSTTHQPWEIVGRYSWSTTAATLSAAIDTVHGTLTPHWSLSRMSANQVFEASFWAQKGRTNVIETTGDWQHWSPVTQLTGSNTVWFTDAPALPIQRRFYRIRVQ